MQQVRFSYLFVLGFLFLLNFGCSSAPSNPCDNVQCTGSTRCYLGECVASCKSGESECGKTCADLKKDKSNCGKCGTVCRDGEVCADGKCTLDCQNSTTLCANACVDTKKDTKHCGACNTACKDGEVCNAGKCELYCPAGTQKCGTTCVNTQSDRNHCGNCDAKCGDGEVCNAGKCELSCQKNYTNCEGNCINTQTDRAHCGACKTACKDGEVCNTGACKLSCKSGQTDCNGGCVDVQTDRSHCGACGTACKDGEVCSAGKCTLSCQKDLLNCSDKCVDTKTDRAHCGACGKACKDGEVCDGGNCALTCASPQVKCGDTCADTQSSNNHCGVCGTVCKGGMVCDKGKCACPTGTTDCSGTCIDTQNSRGNCGTCGTACKSGELCDKGKCVVSCPITQTDCGGKCIDITIDNNNCGACGTGCKNGQTCQSGKCACPTGTTDCGGKCVDTKTDNTNCGACATACGGGKTCQNGNCGCPGGLLDCNGVCTNTSADSANCGACGTVCARGQVCFQGKCSAVCAQGEANCGGFCVNLIADIKNCGSCGKNCKIGEICIAGQCAGVKDYLREGLSSGSDYAYAIAVDTQGNAYVTGYFSTTLVFGGNTLSTNGGSDMFVAKIDAQGQWVWARNAGGTSSDYGDAIAVDQQGNVYVTGRAYDATFGPTSLKTQGGYDVFVAKLDRDGNWMWAINGGSTSSDYAKGIAMDSSGNAYVTGYFYNTGTFGTHTVSAPSSSAEVYVAKVSSTGQWMWVRSGGGSGSDYGNAVAVDNLGFAYITGYFYNTATFGANTIVASGSSADLYVAKISPTGQWMWAQKGGGTDSDYGYGIAVDQVGNSYVTGYTYTSSTWGTTTLSSKGSADILVAKLDTNGKWLWAKLAGGTSSDYGNAISVDAGGNVYIFGEFSSTATFGSVTLSSAGSTDVFISKLDPSGFWIWSRRGGGSSSDYGTGVAVDASSNIYVTGYFSGTGTFFDVGTLTSQGSTDIFVARLVDKGCFPACGAGDTCCSGVCVKIDTDANNCGGCGKACGIGAVCTAQKCNCPTGSTLCGGVCIDTQADLLNCGGCGNVCAGGATCSAGKCACPQGQIACNNICTKVAGDPKNCGACGVACPAGNACQASKCVAAWAQSAGGTSSTDAGYGVAVDSQGNVYVTGQFYSGSSTSPTTLFTFGTAALTGKGGYDVFVAKYSNSGTPIKAVLAGGAGSDYAYGIHVDKTDNVYVTGYFNSGSSTSATIGTFGSLSLTGYGSTDVYVAKLDKDLNFLKVVAAGGTSSTDTGYDVATDATGNVYVTGYFYSGSSTSPTTLFTIGTLTLTGKGGSDIFVAKYDKDLTLLKVATAGGTGSDYGYGISVDAANNVYVTGYFTSGSSTSATIGTFGALSLTGVGGADMFVAKLDKDLNFVKVIGGVCSGSDYGYAVKNDAAGNVYVVGYFYSGATPTTLANFGTTTLTGYGYEDLFVAKYDKDLNVVKAVIGGGDDSEYMRGLAIDSAGNLHVSGYFYSTSATFGTTTLSVSGGGTYADILYVRLDKDLNFLTAKNGGSSTSSELAYGGIAVDNSGNYFITGYFSGTVDWGGPQTTSVGASDIFILKNLP